MRPPVEHYARCSVTVGDFVIEPGVELRGGESDSAIAFVTRCLEATARGIGRCAETQSRAEAMAHAQASFETIWPGRAWFVEIHDAKLERWTQSFQPFGVPRNT